MTYQSRRKRFDEAMGNIENAKSEIEMLKKELESWLDNLPENLQGSTKADMLEEAIGNLDEIINSLEDVVGYEVEFPSMYG